MLPYISRAAGGTFPTVRIPEGKRKFKSPAVEKTIAQVQSPIGNKEIAWMFGNCFPNTLDTTVDFEVVDGRPDTYVITGDIDAMWLRDSSAQVWPYLPFMREDPQFAGARPNSHCEEDRETHQKTDGVSSGWQNWKIGHY